MTKLSSKYKTGSSARAKLIEYFNVSHGVGARTTAEVDHMLAWLDSMGYVVTPVPGQPPARRGNTKKKYTGPSMIGSSHVAKLIA